LDAYIEKIKGGWLEMDVVIATPSVMGKLSTVARVL
jgi:large subunit ribosomal protein L1